MTSQSPDPGLSLGDEEWEAFVPSVSAQSGGQKNISGIQANASIQLYRIFQS